MSREMALERLVDLAVDEADEPVRPHGAADLRCAWHLVLQARMLCFCGQPPSQRVQARKSCVSASDQSRKLADRYGVLGDVGRYDFGGQLRHIRVCIALVFSHGCLSIEIVQLFAGPSIAAASGKQPRRAEKDTIGDKSRTCGMSALDGVSAGHAGQVTHSTGAVGPNQVAGRGVSFDRPAPDHSGFGLAPNDLVAVDRECRYLDRPRVGRHRDRRPFRRGRWQLRDSVDLKALGGIRCAKSEGGPKGFAAACRYRFDSTPEQADLSSLKQRPSGVRHVSATRWRFVPAHPRSAGFGPAAEPLYGWVAPP